MAIRCIKPAASSEGHGLLVALCNLLRSSAAPVQLVICPRVRVLVLLACASFLPKSASWMVAEVAAEWQGLSIDGVFRAAIDIVCEEFGAEEKGVPFFLQRQAASSAKEEWYP